MLISAICALQIHKKDEIKKIEFYQLPSAMYSKKMVAFALAADLMQTRAAVYCESLPGNISTCPCVVHAFESRQIRFSAKRTHIGILI